MTPRESTLALRGLKTREVRLAWWMSALTGCRPRPLEDVLAAALGEDPPEQEPLAQLAAARRIAASFAHLEP